MNIEGKVVEIEAALRDLAATTNGKLDSLAANVAKLSEAIKGDGLGNPGLLPTLNDHAKRLQKLESVWLGTRWAAVGWLAGGGGIGYALAHIIADHPGL